MQSSGDIIPAGQRPADFKKIYLAHIQENTALQQHKSDIDSAKLKKMRELSQNESAFVRKYEEYMDGQKRHLDVGIARVADANSAVGRHLGGRTEQMNTKKLLERYTVDSEIPYSLGSWNMMIDTEANIIESYKSRILRSPDMQTTDNSTSCLLTHTDSTTHKRPHRSPRNKSCLKSERTSIEFKRNTSPWKRYTSAKYKDNRDIVMSPQTSLTPTVNDQLSSPTPDNGVDDEEEVGELQTMTRQRSGRPSHQTGNVPTTERRRRMSLDAGRFKLPMIAEHSLSKREQHLRKISISDTELNNIDTQNHLASCLKNTYPLQSDILANAMICVHGEDSGHTSGRSSRQVNSVVSGLESVSKNTSAGEYEQRKPKYVGRRKSVSFFPIMPTSSSLVAEKVKDLTLREDGGAGLADPMRRRSSSVGACTIAASRERSVSRARSSKRLSIASLKIMVDNARGITKVKYIDMLASEMKKTLEPKVTDTPPVSVTPTEGLQQDVQQCSQYTEI